jgi:hypothetical protein
MPETQYDRAAETANQIAEVVRINFMDSWNLDCRHFSYGPKRTARHRAA